MTVRLKWPLLLLVASFALAYALARTAAAPAPARPVEGRAPSPRADGPRSSAPPESAVPPPPSHEPPAAPAGPLRYVAIGGGAMPESSEVSLEQNLQLLQRVLGGPGLLLFGGGQGSASVRVLDERPPPDPLLVRLGDLFQPRAGRRSRYRPSELHASAARLDEVERTLQTAFAAGDEPLLVYFATHGEQGEQPRDNAVVLWGGRTLTAARLAELHDAQPRPLRVVAASCFSGGFAELAFEAADPARGPAPAPRCGLFAGTWDRETSGCDPDPDRRKQQGYSLHFLHALEGRDRDGQPLPRAALDYDADGRITLLEAHTRAAIAGLSIDVPTTTAEHYLRAVQKTPAAPDPALLPEHQALVRELGARLDVTSARAAEAELRAVQDALDELDARIASAEREADVLYGELAARLLGRFPALDDAYHPDFAATLAREREAILAALDGWPEAQRHAAAERELEALERELQPLELREAQLARLVRAHETLGLAAALRRRGGPAFRHFQQLLACERSTVPTRVTPALERGTATP